MAVSGLGEGLRIHVERPLANIEVGGTGEKIVVRCRDAPNTWTITLLEVGIAVDEGGEDSTGRAELLDTASRLWLMMTGRLSFESVRASGDPEVLRTLQGALELIPPALL